MYFLASHTSHFTVKNVQETTYCFTEMHATGMYFQRFLVLFFITIMKYLNNCCFIIEYFKISGNV